MPLPPAARDARISAEVRTRRLPAGKLSHPAVGGVVAERVVISTPLDPLLSLKALSAYSCLSIRTLRKFTELAPDQALPCYRLPGKVLVRRSTFDAWLNQFQSRGRPSLAKAIRELGLNIS
jgi:hypothetical protein